MRDVKKQKLSLGDTPRSGWFEIFWQWRWCIYVHPQTVDLLEELPDALHFSWYPGNEGGRLSVIPLSVQGCSWGSSMIHGLCCFRV